MKKPPRFRRTIICSGLRSANRVKETAILAGAEKALRRAVELAPNYVDTHWTLGNNLLRQGKSEEAYNEIRQSTIGSDKYVIPAIATAWQIFNGDISLIRKNIGDSPKLNAFLADFLLKREHYDEAFEVWNGISPEMKSVNYRAQSEEIYNQLVSAGKYRYARMVKASLDNQEKTDVFGKVTNGGFENNVRQQKADFFDWQIADAAQPLIGFDDRIKHGGNLSLVIIFNSPERSGFSCGIANSCRRSRKNLPVSSVLQIRIKGSGNFALGDFKCRRQIGYCLHRRNRRKFRLD